ncbi:MAG: hypothetical protein LBT88_01205 [Oscillospiraceae bacterium]|jgi:hypothetical protein|nr:hypothetical protein [Oscillospiraceae bacterium]
MATKLKNLSVTSVDVVNQGANQDAHIRLFKRKDGEQGDSFVQKLAAAIAGAFGKSDNQTDVSKDGAATFADEIKREKMRNIVSQVWDYCYALSDSLGSIIFDDEQDEDAKREMMLTSIDEFAETMREAIPQWASGKESVIGKIEKSKTQEEAFSLFWSNYENAGEEPKEADPLVAKGTINQATNSDTGENNPTLKEEKEMKFDKSKMTTEEQATLADLEKRYGTTEEPCTPASPDATTGAELHPEVKKALEDFDAVKKQQTAEIEELKKSLETERLTAFAKKYEPLGKKADELAAKLYDLKKAGGTVYDDYVALLDENLTTLEKSGLFSEIGKNTQGSAGTAETLTIKASEIAKNGISQADAIVKAFEEHPELAAQYEAEYENGGN